VKLSNQPQKGMEFLLCQAFIDILLEVKYDELDGVIIKE